MNMYEYYNQLFCALLAINWNVNLYEYINPELFQILTMDEGGSQHIKRILFG